MKILTANIAYGFAGMDRLLPSLWHQLHMHGWGVLTYEFFPPLRGKFAEVSEQKRVAYVKRHRHLEPVLKMIERTQPDALVLNEVIYELYRDELERALRGMGFQTICWGVSTHYPGTSISTLVATREVGEPIPCIMPQRPSMGGGAGMAGIRMDAKNLSIFGMHLTYRSPELFKKQVAYIARMVEAEKTRGKGIVMAGDWNESESVIGANADFKKLDLVSADAQEKLTCPVFLPRFLQKPLDHIFIPPSWQRKSVQTIPFGSDHLALLAEVE